MRWVFFLIAVCLCACFDRGDCTDYSSNKLHVGFYNNSSKKTQKIKMDSVLMEGLDSVMYKNPTDSLSSVILPLNYAQDVARFHFYYQSNHSILDLKYTRKTFVLAVDCNAIDLLTLDDATAITIKDLKISVPDITKNAIENIKLYF